jgi:3-oxoacyl-[acyl-carrier-protein] synthase II
MRDAGFGEKTGYVPERTGVIFGSGIGGIATFERQLDICRTEGAHRISPFFVPMYIADIAAGLIAMRFQAKGPNYATVSACSTSGHAIGDAFRMLVYGDADVMIAGGSEAAVTIMSVGGFGNMGALSTRNDSPTTASRPFDVSRDGFVLGEGAGVVILEELSHALARGAHIHAELAGYGATGDAYHLTSQPDDHEGLQRAMRRALEDGELQPTDVQYINAHGTSTPLNDPNEIRAIRKVFGDHAETLNISSTKSATGHTLGAAGALEFIITSLAVEQGIIPPTINLVNQDPECNLNCTPNVAVRRDITAALSNSSGFGGHNVSLAVRRYAP